MVKDILIVADLGAAGNLVRNLLLLSDQTDWPLANDRFATVMKQYQPTLQLKNWLPVENQLRFWQRYYHVDISDDIDIEKFNQRSKKDRPVVYLNHSAFYQESQYQQLTTQVKTLYVAPKTEFGLSWQIRSYCEKKTVEKLHNFTFEKDIEQQKLDYCTVHGADAYYKLNIQNFKDIVGKRQKEFGNPDLSLEDLLFKSADDIVFVLANKLEIAINVEQAQQIIQSWRSLHWPSEQTMSWDYYD